MHDLLHIDGKPFVLVPMHEYRRLTTHMNAGAGAAMEGDLPENIRDLIAAGTHHPVRILRKYRGLTQNALADEARLSRPYLTEIETGKKQGSIGVMKALATALNVPVGLLLPDF